jgi:hypothetical protein
MKREDHHIIIKIPRPENKGRILKASREKNAN